MAKKKSKLIRKYKLVILDGERFSELFSMTISRLKVIFAVLAIALITVVVAYFAVFYTPLKFYMPDYPSPEVWRSIQYNGKMVDSLVSQIEVRDRFIENINNLITGEIPDDSAAVSIIPEEADADMDIESENLLSSNLIGVEAYKLDFNQAKESKTLENISFFTPVSGMVINRFNESPGHYGTDVIGDANAKICSVLDGTVVFAEWSISTGYVVQIQHNFDLVSIYKHNSEMLVKQGDKVKAGDVIAIMGGEGELSSGPHLHIELWQNGTALDPEQYIEF